MDMFIFYFRFPLLLNLSSHAYCPVLADTSVDHFEVGVSVHDFVFDIQHLQKKHNNKKTGKFL